jgi:uncharacterized membrane protein
MTEMIESFSQLWFWELLGRLHPLVVHFPIGVLVTGLFLEILTFGGKRPELRPGIRWLVFIGAFTSVLSALFGLMLAYSGNYPASTLDYHRITGLVTVILAIISAVLLRRAEISGNRKDLGLYRAVLAATVILLTVSGHFGATLTHGSNYLTSALPWNYESVSEGEHNEFLAGLNEHLLIGGTLSEPHLNELNIKVRRIFAESCYRCHDSDTYEGGLALDSRDGVFAGGDGGAVIIPGHPENSEIIRRLLLPGGDEQVMPQRGRALFSDEIELIRKWIEFDAYWPEHDTGIFREAELALSKPEPPDAPAEFTNAIDRFIHVYFEEHGLNWPEPANDPEFIRRVYLDTIGLLPEPGEVEGFLADDSPDKRNRLIESLLQQDHDYAQHSLTFWNDLLRNAYTGTGFITGGRKQITGWLYDALQNNKPYDEMVRELVNPTAESEGFVRGIQWRGDFNSSQSTEMQAAQNISQSLLAVNLKCASCHNSFTSNLTLNQAYSFAAVFTDSLLAIERCEVPTGDYATPGFFYNELGDIDGSLPVSERLEQLADLITDTRNGRLYRTIANRKWALLMGRGLVEPTDEMDLEPWNQELLDWLAAELIDQDHDLKKLIATIMGSRAYQLKTVGLDETATSAGSEFLFRGPLIRRMTAEQFADAVSRLTAPIYHSVAFDPFQTEFAEANWIWYDARQDDRTRLPDPGVYYFRHMFNLPDDKPVREARLLITADESYKLFVNEILADENRDWRTVNRVNLSGMLKPGKNLLALEAVNGGNVPNPAGVLLNLKITFADGSVTEIRSTNEWKSVDSEPGNGWETVGFNDDNWGNTRHFGNSRGSTHWGRLMDFSHNERAGQMPFIRASLVANDPFLTALGRPAREIVITRRDAEATLLQAMELTNGELLNEVLQRGAERWLTEYQGRTEEMIQHIYLIAFSRNPTEREKRIAIEFLQPDNSKDALQDLLWAMVMQPEFQFIY